MAVLHIASVMARWDPANAIGVLSFVDLSNITMKVDFDLPSLGDL